jgi:hypothetical protein
MMAWLSNEEWDPINSAIVALCIVGALELAAYLVQKWIDRRGL